MFIDDKGKLFGKISIIDLLIIVFILVALFGTYYKFFLAGKRVDIDKVTTIQYEVRINGVRTPTVKAVSEGIDVFDDATGNHIGKVVKKTVKPEEGTILKPDGTYVKADMPERYTVTLTIDADGFEDDYGFFVGGKKQLKRDTTLIIRTRLVTFESTVMDVNVKE